MMRSAEQYINIKGEKYKLVGIEPDENKAYLWAENMRRSGEKIRTFRVTEGRALYRKEHF